MRSQTQPGARLAVVLNKHTGNTSTVPVEQVADMPSDWMLVCTEPEEFAGPESDASDHLVRPYFACLKHCHAGEPSQECPKEPDADVFELLPPSEWQAVDLAHLHQLAQHTLGEDTLIWCMRLMKTPKTGHRTVIDIEPGRQQQPGTLQHRLHMEYDGHPNAATMAWLMAHADRFELAIATDPNADHNLGRPRLPREPRRKGRTRVAKGEA